MTQSCLIKRFTLEVEKQLQNHTMYNTVSMVCSNISYSHRCSLLNLLRILFCLYLWHSVEWNVVLLPDLFGEMLQTFKGGFLWSTWKVLRKVAYYYFKVLLSQNATSKAIKVCPSEILYTQQDVPQDKKAVLLSLDAYSTVGFSHSLSEAEDRSGTKELLWFVLFLLSEAEAHLGHLKVEDFL